MLYSKLTHILKIKATHSGVDPGTTEVIQYTPMRVLAKFEVKGYDWFQVADWDESLPGVLSAALRLRVHVVPG